MGMVDLSSFTDEELNALLVEKGENVSAEDKSRSKFKTSKLERGALGIMNSITGGAASGFDKFLADKYGQERTPEDLSYNVGRAVGMVPVGSIAAKMVGAIPKLGAAEGIAAALGRGAIEGGVTGSYTTPEDRISSGLMGAAIGAPMAALANPVIGINRANQALSSQETALGVPSGKLPLSQRMASKLAFERASLKQATTEIGASVKNFDEQIFKQAQAGVDVTKERLPAFFKNNSIKYGEKLDEIASRLSTEGRTLTKRDLDNIFSSTIDEIKDLGVADSDVLSEIEKLQGKYGIKFIAGQNPKSFSTPRIATEDTVDFKQVVKDLKGVKRLISSQVKGGGRFNQDDLGIAILNKNFGKYVPELGELNAQYKPVIDAMKEATRKFKPFNGDFNDRAGINFLKKVANQGAKGLTEGEKALIKAIESGDENFASGIGDVTSSIKKLGVDKNNLIKSLQNNKARVDKLALDMAKAKPSIQETEANLKHLRNVRNWLYGTTGAVAIGGGKGVEVAKELLFGGR